eukprot:CAMPEP_0206163032 /NCGR_PEP_ID=MMETSP1474-20131121/11167_1 /ASSEMBLY_ACC=CAM_ASM_001110 /TAXON_ID=97495 /ORGANISM="Imantonia sp., Strain RCC918" /LENGTH=80 /DNA_ID=CAMNT_0053565447 /DNA_START=1 /DNA_END=240 /DNA_ORIENTATION=-
MDSFASTLCDTVWNQRRSEAPVMARCPRRGVSMRNAVGVAVRRPCAAAVQAWLTVFVLKQAPGALAPPRSHRQLLLKEAR